MSNHSDLVRKIEESKTQLFGPFHQQLEEESRAKGEKHDWSYTDKNGISYKIYPSGLKSDNMCPKHYIEVEVHQPSYFGANALEAMAAGTAIHTMVESKVSQIEGFIAKPDLSYYRELYPQYADNVEKKCNDSAPEAYILAPDLGVGLSIDIPKANGLIGDLKTVNIPDYQWNKKENKIDSGCWAKFKAAPPDLRKHKFQCFNYVYFWNKFKYSTEPMTGIFVAYFNTCMAKSTSQSIEGPYFETPVYTYTDQIERILEEFWAEMSKHRNAYISGAGPQPCEYSYCGKHGKRMAK